jgi:hypothetical protein
MSLKPLKPKSVPVRIQEPRGELLLMEMSVQCAIDLAREWGLKHTEVQLKRSLLALRAEMEGAEISKSRAQMDRSPMVRA